MNNKYAENTVYSNTVMAVKPALTQETENAQRPSPQGSAWLCGRPTVKHLYSVTWSNYIQLMNPTDVILR